MQPGQLVWDDVAAYTSKVLVNGAVRPVLSWSIDRALEGDLPQQVVGSSGISQATGTISWGTKSDVSERDANPWNSSTGWVPKSGDRVEIFVGDGVTEWKQFHGVIDKTTGSIGDGFQSTIIDDYDKLSAVVERAPLLGHMTPADPGGPYRGIGLASTYYADLALRAAGFYSLPRPEANSAVVVPCQHSMWPALGRLMTCVKKSGTGLWPLFYSAKWGWVAADFTATLEPFVKELPSKAVQLTVNVSSSHSGTFILAVEYGSISNSCELVVWPTRVATARVNGVVVADVPLGEASTVSMLVKSGTVTLKTDKGGVVTGTGTISGSTRMSKVRIDADASARVAGIQVSHPAASQEFASLRHAPNARIDASNQYHAGPMDVGPAIDRVSASEILSQIGSATLTAGWIDETGVFQWVPSIVLSSRSPSLTVTTQDHVFGLDWESTLLGSRSQVDVTGKQYAVSHSRNPSVQLYEGPGAELESQDVNEEFIKPENGEEWIISDDPIIILSPNNWAGYNRRRSVLSGVYYSTDGVETTAAGLETTITMERLGVATYKISHVAGVFPPSVTAHIRTSPTSPGLYERNRDKPLPVISGFAKATVSDITVTSLVPGGVGPVLTHDAGPWNNRGNSTVVLTRIADYLASQTSVPAPVITGLDITPDPRLQLGDVITISSPDFMGVRVTALVVGVSNSMGNDGLSQSLTVRVINATTTFATYAQYNDSLGARSMSYQQWQAIGPVPETYSQFNAQA